MVSTSRLIAGILFLVGGIVINIISFYSSLIFLIYGVPLIILGLVILLNKNEDRIEPRLDGGEKDLNKMKSKK